MAYNLPTTSARLRVGATALLNANGYQVVRVLGTGMYSEVLLIQDINGTRFAAKVLQDPERAASADKTVIEARVLQRLGDTSPHIIKMVGAPLGPRTVDLYETGGVPVHVYVLLFQLADCGSLKDVLEKYQARGEPVPEPFLASVIGGVLSALAYMHFGATAANNFQPQDGWQPITHGDVHEGNILLDYGTRNPMTQYPRPVLADFGCAGSEDDHTILAPPHKDLFDLGMTISDAAPPANEDEDNQAEGSTRAPGWTPQFERVMKRLLGANARTMNSAKILSSLSRHRQELVGANFAPLPDWARAPAEPATERDSEEARASTDAIAGQHLEEVGASTEAIAGRDLEEVEAPAEPIIETPAEPIAEHDLEAGPASTSRPAKRRRLLKKLCGDCLGNCRCSVL